MSGEQSFRTYSSTPVSFGLRQDLRRPNTSAWDRREQPIRWEVAERQYLEAREDIAIQTAALFFDAYAARVALNNAIKNAAVNDTLYTLNKGRFEVGRIGENDLLQVSSPCSAPGPPSTRPPGAGPGHGGPSARAQSASDPAARDRGRHQRPRIRG